MKILIVGSGGREHALVYKLSKSPKTKKIYCAPGNAGISEMAECVHIKVDDINGLVKFAEENKIDLTVVGPELPLSLGIVDVFEKEGLLIFGPSREASLLESSKSFAKDFMKRFSIPTGSYEIFYEKDEAIDYIKKGKFPVVIKADGLASGKGVIIVKTIEEANQALEEILVKKVFGNAGHKIVIEEFLEGEEVTFLAFVDGKTFIPMVSSQDHKRVFDNDEGPNTGGMGAYSPVSVLKKQIEDDIINKILYQTVFGMSSLGKEYKGVLYLGLMLTKEGPKLLEYNCRFGDPETQVVLPRLKSDLVDVIMATSTCKLNEINVIWDEKPAVCVVLASGGYPGKYENGKEIKGLDEVKKLKDIFVFHSGTARKDGKIVTNGGRVLGVTGIGDNLRQTVDKVYSAIDKIHFDGRHYRKDIAKKAFR
ncbi:MAG: phosphoribosylamine--glycine ligase [Candidatus Firestonebacteria bacterium]